MLHELFITLCIQSGNYSITVSEKQRKYSAFTPEYVKCKFQHVPFGIHVAQTYFVIMINETRK